MHTEQNLTKFLIKTFLGFIYCSIPIIFSQIVRYFAGATFSWLNLAIVSWFVVSILLLTINSSPIPNGKDKCVLQINTIILITGTIVAVIIYGAKESTFAAWISLIGIFSILQGLTSCLTQNHKIIKKAALEVGFAFLAGTSSVLFEQITTRFSTEEFFIGIEIVTIIAFWAFLRILVSKWLTFRTQYIGKEILLISQNRLILFIVCFTIVGIFSTLVTYQRSFYPQQAPQYPGVSASSPFTCNKLIPEENNVAYEGEEVFDRLIKRVEANPRKGVPEFGMLALATRELKWANTFHDHILREAEKGQFTKPSNSVKYGQYLAAQRVYYYANSLDVFPNLFSDIEHERLREWFHDINKHALTPEWVDWLYGLAFGFWPEGPYENQDIGVGLLALLELNGLADPRLTSRNQNYLLKNQRGWLSNFRVTDDAAVYQGEWITNAWFQSLYIDQKNQLNTRLSFEWLKLLTQPNGKPLQFNHIGSAEIAKSAYLGALLTQDSDFIWLSGRALDYLETHNLYLKAQPGIEKPLSVLGKSPEEGSCLIFGDSGLPTKMGPLAPDKIVFREGWENDNLYLMLNLRFTGWHRYKATNTITNISKDIPLVIENIEDKTFEWLPIGRSILRDKRISRENLNGLIIGKQGLSAVLYSLTGIGSPWAQDPPYYSDILQFETNSETDISKTAITNWHGWDHIRTVFFYQTGLVIILDEINGPENGNAGLRWHFAGENQVNNNRLIISEGDDSESSVEVILFPLTETQLEYYNGSTEKDMSFLRVQENVPSDGILNTVTIFLTNDWRGADIFMDDSRLNIITENDRVSLSLAAMSNE